MKKEQPSFWYVSRQLGGEFTIHPDFPMGPLPVPGRVKAEGDRLFWSPDVEGHREVNPPENLLAVFAGLASAAPEEIAAFAEQFGVLEICEHELPRSHNPSRPWKQSGQYVEECFPLGWHERSDPEWMCREPLSVWYMFAGDARAILRIAANLHGNRVGSPVDWRTIFGHGRGPESIPWWKPSVEGERFLVAGLVNEWLQLGDVRPRLAWGSSSKRANGTPGLIMAGGGLFGALAIQLAQSVSRSEGLYICDGCGAAHTRAKKPDPNRRKFCPKCRNARVPQKLAQRDHVVRKEGSDGS